MLFNESNLGDNTPRLIGDTRGVYGADCTGLGKNAQLQGIMDLVLRAKNGGSKILLEVGHGIKNIKCPPRTLCLKTDLSSGADVDSVLKQKSGFTGFFQLDANELPIDGLDMVYTIAPFPLVQGGELNTTSILAISLSASRMLKSHGIFVVVYDPSFNESAINRIAHPKHYTTEEVLGEIKNELGGTSSFGYLFKKQPDGKASLYKRYLLNGTLRSIFSNISSDYFSMQSTKNVMGLVFFKK